MRKIYSTSFISLTWMSLLSLPALAQSNSSVLGDPGTIIVPSSSSSYNQQGFNLPSAPRSSGQDIVRGSGGISCQSSVGGNGPVLDLGVIGTNDIYSRDSTALYGRITVPLGKKPKRVDCSKLYDLEIQRLKMELQLMRAGGMGGFSDEQGARNILRSAQPAEPDTVKTQDVKKAHRQEPPEPLIISRPTQQDAKKQPEMHIKAAQSVPTPKPPTQSSPARRIVRQQYRPVIVTTANFSPTYIERAQFLKGYVY